MKEQTHLGDTIDAADIFKVRYDKSVKEILADVQVLARIVKHTVSEAENLSTDEIIGCIDAGSIRIGTVPITPGLTNAGKDRKSTRLNSSHLKLSRMPSSA